MTVRSRRKVPRRRPSDKVRDRRTRDTAAPPKREPTPPSAAAPAVPLLRTSKGTRPAFFDEPAIDQLFAIATALAAEVSVAFDRIDTLEQLLQQAGTLAPEAVDGFHPGPQVVDARKQRRAELLQRLFAVFEHSGPARTR